MKKSTTVASPLLVGLTLLSIFCYFYLHKVAADTTGHCPSAYHERMIEEEVNTNGSRIATPAVFIVKRIFSLSNLVGND